MASRKVRVIGAFHHSVEEIYYATLLHVGCWVTSLHRGLRSLFELRSIVEVFLLPGYDALVDHSLRLSGRFDSCIWWFDSKPSISPPSKNRLAKSFDIAKLFEFLRTAQ